MAIYGYYCVAIVWVLAFCGLVPWSGYTTNYLEIYGLGTGRSKLQKICVGLLIVLHLLPPLEPFLIYCWNLANLISLLCTYVGYTRSRSRLHTAQTFPFLNGVHNKWCKLDFEHYGIHANKIAFCNTFAHVPSKS